jgi:hypothetical protein
MTMPIPRVRFIEENSGITPIRIQARNRICIIAPFTRGPVNFFRYIGGYTDFANTYGSDLSTGSLAYQVAYDQGARDFACLRILGSGQPACGKLTFSGYANKDNNIILYLKIIAPTVNRTNRELKTLVFSNGNYISEVSGRFWFKVTGFDGINYTVKWVFVPLDIQDGYIAWMDSTPPDTITTVDPGFIQAYKDKIILDTTNISGMTGFTVTGAEPFVYGNNCLDLGRPGESCTLGVVNGWKVTVTIKDMQYIWHTNQDLTQVRLNEDESGYTGILPIYDPNIALNTTNFTSIETGYTGPLTQRDTTNLPNVILVPQTNILTVNKDNDAGKDFNIENGLTIQFDTVTNLSDIDFTIGDTWSVRANSDTWVVPIFKGSQPNQVATAMIDVLAGADPLGTVERTIEDNGVQFCLMPEEAGTAGNRYSYYVDLEKPDGEVICPATYAGSANATILNTVTQLQVDIKFAEYIEVGAVISHLDIAGSQNVVYELTGPLDSLTGPQKTYVSSQPNLYIAPGVIVKSITIPTIGSTMANIEVGYPNGVSSSNPPIVSKGPTSTSYLSFKNIMGLSVSNYTFLQSERMFGGVDGPRRASRDFYSFNNELLLSLYATSEGAWGNDLRVTIYPLTNELFHLSVEDLNKDSYDPPLANEYYSNVSFRDTDADGALNALKVSKFIRGTFMPKAINKINMNVKYFSTSIARLKPADPVIVDPEDPAHPYNFGPKWLRQVHLERGFDGPPITDNDYFQALKLVKEKSAHILITPGVYESQQIKQTLMSHTASASELEGLRIAVINAKPQLLPEAADLETVGYGYTRGVMVAGWCTYAGISNTGRYGQSPDAVYAGKIAVTPFFVSPAARTDAGPIYSISEVDTQMYNSKNQLQVFTNARLEVIHLDPNLGAFYFLNGRNLSSDTQWDKISYRRTFDIIRGDIYALLQQYKSNVMSNKVFSRISSSIDSYLGTLTRNGSIRRFTGAQVTSQATASGLVEVRFSVVPHYAMDYIDVYLTRDDDGNYSARPTMDG